MTRKHWLAAALLLVLLLAVLADRFVLNRTGSSATQATSAAQADSREGAEPGQTEVPGLRARGNAGASSQAPRLDVPTGGGGDGGAVLSPSYELTVAAPNLVAVNLSGGLSSVTTFTEPGPPPDVLRHVRGRVLSSDGEAVESAIVLVGDQLAQRWGSLTAQQGAVSDPQGRFTVPVYSRGALHAMAVHQVVGWSKPRAVPAGDVDVELELRIPVPGKLRGSVTRGGEPEAGELELTAVDATLSLQMKTGDDGAFEYPRLPAGAYRLRAGLAQEIAGGASKDLQFDVSIRSGETTVQDVALPVGILLAAQAVAPRDTKIRMVEYTLLRGEHQPSTAEELAALLKTPAGEGHRYRLFGGEHKEHVMQFHDLLPGTVTVCVTVRETRATSAGFRCQRAVLDPSQSVRELTFDFNR